jgi:hypothetical protein
MKGKLSPILSSPKAKKALSDHCLSLEAKSRSLDLDLGSLMERDELATHMERVIAAKRQRAKT